MVTAIVDDAPERVPLDDDGSSRPLSSTAFHVRFDRFMDPRTLIRQAYCLRSEQADVVGFEGCTNGISDTLPRYDPVTRTLSIYLAEHLAPDTLYKLTLLAPREGPDVGLRAFDGVPLESSIVKTFRTLADPADVPELEAPPADEDAPSCDEIAVALRTCQVCHGSKGLEGEPLSVPEGFSVERPDLPGLIGRTAHQTQMGNDANTAQDRAARFGANMPLVDAKRSPGNSYLLYKLLAHTPPDPEDTLAENEAKRLRSSLVVGMPMPAVAAVEEGLTAPAPLTQEQLVDLSRWIAAGAPCP